MLMLIVKIKFKSAALKKQNSVTLTQPRAPDKIITAVIHTTNIIIKSSSDLYIYLPKKSTFTVKIQIEVPHECWVTHSG